MEDAIFWLFLLMCLGVLSLCAYCWRWITLYTDAHHDSEAYRKAMDYWRRECKSQREYMTSIGVYEGYVYRILDRPKVVPLQGEIIPMGAPEPQLLLAGNDNPAAELPKKEGYTLDEIKNAIAAALKHHEAVHQA